MCCGTGARNVHTSTPAAYSADLYQIKASNTKLSAQYLNNIQHNLIITLALGTLHSGPKEMAQFMAFYRTEADQERG